MSIYRNKKQEKTGPKNKGVRALCKEANEQIVKNAPALIKALCDRIIEDGSPETTNALIRLAEMLDLNEKAEAHERKMSILDLWESEPEWSGEVNEATTETAPGSREPEGQNATEQAATVSELGIHQPPQARQEDQPKQQTKPEPASKLDSNSGSNLGSTSLGSNPDPFGLHAFRLRQEGKVTPSGFVVYNGAASPAPKKTKAVDQPGR
jgi:hypothetical protein